MCGESSTSKAQGRSEGRSTQHPRVQTKQPQPHPAMQQAGPRTWNSSSVTLVQGDITVKSAGKLENPSAKQESIASRLRKHAVEADMQEKRKLRYFSSSKEGTKFAKLGVGQLYLEGKLSCEQIFSFTAATGGHRCLVCNRKVVGVPQSMALMQISGEEAKIRGNYHNVLCSGDCYVTFSVVFQKDQQRILNYARQQFLGGDHTSMKPAVLTQPPRAVFGPTRQAAVVPYQPNMKLPPTATVRVASSGGSARSSSAYPKERKGYPASGHGPKRPPPTLPKHPLARPR